MGGRWRFIAFGWLMVGSHSFPANQFHVDSSTGQIFGTGKISVNRIMDRHIGKAAILGILLVWICLTLLMMMSNLVIQLRISSPNYGAYDIFWFILQTAPRSAYQIFPVSALMGTLLGIGALAGANELVAFRIAGVSRLRLAAAGLSGALLIAVPVMILGEWIAPALEQQARASRLSQLAGRIIIGGPKGTWMRDGNNIVNIRRPLLTVDQDQQSISFQDLEIYHFESFSGLQKISRAKNAFFDGEQWTLEGVSMTEIGSSGVTQVSIARIPWDFGVKPELLQSAVTRPRHLSLRILWEQMQYLQSNGLDDRVYKSAFWGKVFYPFTIIALVLAGMPFVFGSSRQQDIGFRIFVGMTLGSLFMLVNGAAQNLAAAFALSVALSAVLPAAILTVVAIVVLRRVV